MDTANQLKDFIDRMIHSNSELFAGNAASFVREDVLDLIDEDQD